MIIRVPDAETLSGVEKFVHRLVTEWGPGDGRVGGVAVFDCPIPRPRRGRSAPAAADLVVWTPHGCTVVAIRGFGSVQHGPLEVRGTGRWSVGDRPADLAVSKSAPNPLLQAHKQAAELRNCFRQHGLADEIEILVVLVPKTGSRITWDGTSPEPGSDIVLVRIGQSAALTEYFRRPRTGPVRWRAEDVTRVFEVLDLDEHLPTPEESAVEGFPTSMPVPDLVPSIDEDPAVRAVAPEPVAVDAETVGADAGGYGETPVVVPVPLPSDEALRVDTEARRGEGAPFVAGRETEDGVGVAPMDSDGGAGAAAGAVAVSGDTEPVSEGSSAIVAGIEAGPDEPAPERRGGAVESVSAVAPESEPKERLGSDVASLCPAPSSALPPEKAVSSAPPEGELVSSAVADTVLDTGAGDAAPRRRTVDVLAARKIAESSASAATGLSAGAAPERGDLRAVRTGPTRRDPTGTETEPRPAPHRKGPLDRAAGWPVIGVALRRPVALLTAGVLVVVALVASAFAASGIARFDIEEYERMCAEPRGFTTAASYTSTGPNPIYLAGDLRAAGFAGSPVWRPEDPSSVQLIACLSSAHTGTLVRTCQYEPTGGRPIGRTLNLFRGVHRITVYEARTGRLLAGAEVDGERFSADPASTEADICRAAEGAPDDGLPGRRYGRLSQRQIRDVLDPLVRPGRVS